MSKKYLSDNLVVNDLISGDGRISIKGNILTNPNGIVLYDHRTIYTMMSNQTIENTTIETSHFNDINAIGTRTFPANLLSPGNVIRINVRSDFSSSGNPANIMRVNEVQNIEERKKKIKIMKK